MKRDTVSDRVFDIINFTLLGLAVLAVLYPLWFVLVASVSNPDEVSLGNVYYWPKGFTLEGYQRILEYRPVWIGYRNSIFYAVVGTTINLFVTLTCAYALSRKDFMGRNVLTALFTFTMFFNGGLIPTFLVVKQLGMVNTVWALIIPNAAAMWNIILTRTYYKSNIPTELQEAAFMDGCSNTRLFLTIVLPLSAPIIAVMALFYGVTHWNSYFPALIYLRSRDLMPLQIFLREVLVQNEIVDFMSLTSDEMETIARRQAMAQIMKYSLIIVATVPVLIIYPFVQRYYVKGIMVGSIKG
jgi:putative aldouronate transport system permease protein